MLIWLQSRAVSSAEEEKASMGKDYWSMMNAKDIPNKMLRQCLIKYALVTRRVLVQTQTDDQKSPRQMSNSRCELGFLVMRISLNISDRTIYDCQTASRNGERTNRLAWWYVVCKDVIPLAKSVIQIISVCNFMFFAIRDFNSFDNRTTDQ